LDIWKLLVTYIPSEIYCYHIRDERFEQGVLGIFDLEVDLGEIVYNGVNVKELGFEVKVVWWMVV